MTDSADSVAAAAAVVAELAAKSLAEPSVVADSPAAPAERSPFGSFDRTPFFAEADLAAEAESEAEAEFAVVDLLLLLLSDLPPPPPQWPVAFCCSFAAAAFQHQHQECCYFCRC